MVKICDVIRNDDIIREKLNSLIYKGKRDRREYGLSICLNDKLITTEPCTGTECEIKIQEACPKEMEEVSFHVHPPEYDYIPSGPDYVEVARAGHNAFCIGYTQMYIRNFTDCYKVPDIVKFRVESVRSAIKEQEESTNKEEAEQKLKTAISNIVDIENIDVGRKMDLASTNRLCRVGVSFKEKEIKKYNFDK